MFDAKIDSVAGHANLWMRLTADTFQFFLDPDLKVTLSKL